MKQWKKSICIVAAVLAICVAAILSLGNETECCLCNAPTSSVPCLIDLETGDILELSLDGPSTPGPNGQTDVSTFSFIRFGDIIGTKQTTPNVIELKIPVEEKVRTPALCSKCHKSNRQENRPRYVLADMHSTEDKRIIPLTAGLEMQIGCYSISIQSSKANKELILVVQ